MTERTSRAVGLLLEASHARNAELKRELGAATEKLSEYRRRIAWLEQKRWAEPQAWDSASRQRTNYEREIAGLKRWTHTACQLASPYSCCYSLLVGCYCQSQKGVASPRRPTADDMWIIRMPGEGPIRTGERALAGSAGHDRPRRETTTRFDGNVRYDDERRPSDGDNTRTARPGGRPRDGACF